jgi:uncharacterized glyoxalase superfamily protein PhnB
MQHLGIYLVMKGNCEEAFNYYQSIFGGWNPHSADHTRRTGTFHELITLKNFTT